MASTNRSRTLPTVMASGVPNYPTTHNRISATRDEARGDLFAYIAGVCNSRRLDSATGYKSPADMERMAA